MTWLLFIVFVLLGAILVYVGWYLAVNNLAEEYEHMRLMRQNVEDEVDAMYTAAGLMDAFIQARSQVLRHTDASEE